MKIRRHSKTALGSATDTQLSMIFNKSPYMSLSVVGQGSHPTPFPRE
jgi:hypothetical protein